MNVLVVGAGLMGSQIACEYALGGHVVWLHTRSEDRALSRIRDTLDLVDVEGLAPSTNVDQARTRIRLAPSLNSDIDLIVESLPEDLPTKVEVVSDLARRFHESIIATNTSSLSVSAVGDALDAPGRTIGTHYWNPPVLMPLVELRGRALADEVREFATSCSLTRTRD